MNLAAKNDLIFAPPPSFDWTIVVIGGPLDTWVSISNVGYVARIGASWSVTIWVSRRRLSQSKVAAEIRGRGRGTDGADCGGSAESGAGERWSPSHQTPAAVRAAKRKN